MINQSITKQSDHIGHGLSFRSLRHALAVTALLFLSLGLATIKSPGRTTLQKPHPTPDRALVCAVSLADGDSQNNMDPVVIVENGKFQQPYAQYYETAQRQFANRYFLPDTKYRVTFGGGEVGSLTVKTWDMGCNNIHATAIVDDHGKIPAKLSALATNSESLGRRPSSRRAPTDAERAAINLMVTQIYRSRGATRALLRSVVTTNLTATDLNGDGKFELIGSYTAETKTKARRDLLLIAEPDGLSFKSTLVNYQSYKLPPEGFDSAINFVDQVDLDGDGVAEVFVQQHGFDAYGYSIYKKQRGRWRIVFTTTGDAC
jgi:hypothetical protein